MIHSSTLRAAAALLVMCVVTACKDDRPVTGPLDPAPTPAPNAATGTIRVTNITTSAIWFVYFSPCLSTGWGVDRLGEDVIPSGNSMQWSSIPTGCWDVRAVLSDGRAAERRGMTVSAGVVSDFRPAVSAFARTATTDGGTPALSLRSTTRLP